MFVKNKTISIIQPTFFSSKKIKSVDSVQEVPVPQNSDVTPSPKLIQNTKLFTGIKENESKLS